MAGEKRVSFRQKNITVCPVCSNEFHREEMLSGGGRLIAGNLTDELRRNYEVSKKYGRVYPLIYLIVVCPKCLFAAYPKDFQITDTAEKEKLESMAQTRIAAIKKYFGPVSFDNERDLMTGAASFMLAVDCYGFRTKKIAPSFKIAVSSIRAAWLFNDLSAEYPDRPYRKISHFFYRKAYLYYVKVLDLIQSGEEPAEQAGSMGPDTDKNWGYEGILYMTAILSVKVGSKEPDIQKRIENFENCKRYLSRLFGMGKSSKSTPSELLDKTRDLYDRLNEMLEQWYQETGKVLEE